MTKHDEEENDVPSMPRNPNSQPEPTTNGELPEIE